MRQRDLEIILERVPPHPDPKPHLEQYRTPAPLAADLLMRALALGDIRDRSVLDLGCGTGVFAIGASLLGAARVVGLDVDAAAIEAARGAATHLDARIEWLEADVSDAPRGFDTVVQNPPFGAQVPHADRPFLRQATASARVVYTLHLTTTGEWVVAEAQRLGARLTHAWDYEFPIRHQFRFHEKAVKLIGVTAFRFERED